MADLWTKGLDKDAVELVTKAVRALRLHGNEILAVSVSPVDGGTPVAKLVTVGGTKVIYRDGDELKPLSDVQAGRAVKPAQAP